MNKKDLIYKIVLTSIFTALCFVATFVHIPLGSSKIHLGNLICLLVSLLCGGLVGGLSGSLGMGLNDLIFGYGPDTYIRTFIVKFLMGFVTGIIFKCFIKKKIDQKPLILLIGSFFFALFIFFLDIYLIKGETIVIGGKSITISIILLVLLVVGATFFFSSFFISHKFNRIGQFVFVAGSIGYFVNIVLEMIIKVPFKMLFQNMTFEASLIYCISSLPSALITMMVTLLILGFIYYPIYKATERINNLNTIKEDIDKLITK